MKNAFLKLQEDGFQKVVIIGSDSPSLPLSYIEAAFDSDCAADAMEPYPASAPAHQRTSAQGQGGNSCGLKELAA